MTLSAATITLGRQPILKAAAPLPLEALVLGKPVTEVVELLPRLFNLCRMAQGLAAKLALGLRTTEDHTAEIIRDHVLKLCITLPKTFGLAPIPLPTVDLHATQPAPSATLLGPHGLPSNPADIEGPLAPLFRQVAKSFPPDIATCSALSSPKDPLAAGAYENSAAGRQSAHALLRSIEDTHGRGPLWRLAGLMADLEAALGSRLPVPSVRDGTATVPAARGTYALRLTAQDGLVTGLNRRTPTDHLLAPGGALLQSLTSLPEPLHHLAPQVIALHDPCIPVTVRMAADA